MPLCRFLKRLIKGRSVYTVSMVITDGDMGHFTHHDLANATPPGVPRSCPSLVCDCLSNGIRSLYSALTLPCRRCHPTLTRCQVPC